MTMDVTDIERRYGVANGLIRTSFVQLSSYQRLSVTSAALVLQEHQPASLRSAVPPHHHNTTVTTMILRRGQRQQDREVHVTLHPTLRAQTSGSRLGCTACTYLETEAKRSPTAQRTIGLLGPDQPAPVHTSTHITTCNPGVILGGPDYGCCQWPWTGFSPPKNPPFTRLR